MGKQNERAGDADATKISTLEVVEPPIGKNVGTFVGLAIAGVFTVIGLLMMISLILFIPGLLSVLTGMVALMLSVPKAEVICPACDNDNKVMLKSKSLTCESCGTVTPLSWTE